MGNRILVIEDNLMNRALIKQILTHNKYEIMEAENGLEGIKMAVDQKPDLILMDLQMPVFDGFESIKYLKSDARTKHIKIIAVTSLAMKGDMERAMSAGADGYVTKPINTRELPDIIKKYLER